MNVGVVVSSVSRSAGGLFLSVRYLSHHVKRSGPRVFVFSPSDRFSNEDIRHWDGLDVRVSPKLGPGAFGYAPSLGAALEEEQLDIVHSHGLWMFPSYIAWRWSLQHDFPLIISPRGMLDPWALRHSAWKKKLAGLAFQDAHLRRAACLHALCESEYEAMRAYGLRNPVAVIPNGIELPSLGQALPCVGRHAERPGEKLRVLFLSRLHPKKGLPNLLHAWANVRVANPRLAGTWRLVIAGWDQVGHLRALERLASSLGVESSVEFLGGLYNEAKAAELARADAFVLPSLSEGLPMAVLEAWAAGLPVLMTPGCNLPEGFAANAALRIAPEPGSIGTALSLLFSMSEEDRQAMGTRGRRLVEERFAWPKIARDMCEVYRWVVGQGPRPDTVRID